MGKDAEMGKQTLVTLLGVEGARAEAEKRARRAVEALGPYAAKAPELSALPFFLLDRDSLKACRERPDFCRLVRVAFMLSCVTPGAQGDFHEPYFEIRFPWR